MAQAGIALAPGEIVVREYHVAALWHSNVWLTVTDRRIVVSASSSVFGRRVLVREVHLSDVTGVTAYIGGGTSGPAGVVAVASVMVALWLRDLSQFLVIAALIVAGYFAWQVAVSLGERIHISVQTKSGAEVPLTHSAALGWGGGGTARPVAGWAEAGPDAERVVQELGALVLDLQTSGHSAAERWRAT